MSLSRHERFSRRDANHNPLVALYRQLGCSVLELHAVGFGCPDAMVGCVGLNEWVEFKSDEGGPTTAQERFIRDWSGGKPKIVRTEQDVIDHVTNMRRRVR